ncbi:hypothetical protein Pelo_17366 [Pelomyxa schiedti]|nr:hypothetical protein Pelo_17366 [Pelomyxa schiedti]
MHLEVFEWLYEAGVKLKPSKCEFCLDTIIFLGHIMRNVARLSWEFQRPKLKKYEQNYPITELEVLAVVCGIV